MSNDLTDLQEEQSRFGKIETHELHDLSDVHRAFKELTELDLKSKETADQAKKDREAVDKWEADQQRVTSSRIDFLHREIMAVYLNNGMVGKLSSPWGSATVSNHKPSTAWTDEKAALKHFKDNGDDDLITKKVTESINKVEAKKRIQVVGNVCVDEDGQVVPGVSVKPAYTSVTFKTGGAVDD